MMTCMSHLKKNLLSRLAKLPLLLMATFTLLLPAQMAAAATCACQKELTCAGGSAYQDVSVDPTFCPSGQICCNPYKACTELSSSSYTFACQPSVAACTNRATGSYTDCTGANIVCCGTSTSAPKAASTTAATTATCAPAAGGLHLQLPCCIQSGNCSLDDIVTTGGYFANFITGLSAAFFFAAFVYGGAMYLISFGDSKRVEKGKTAMTGAAYGMAIVLFAWTLVNYLANSLTGKK